MDSLSILLNQRNREPSGEYASYVSDHILVLALSYLCRRRGGDGETHAPSGEVIQQLGDGAERLLRGRAPGCSQSQHRRHNKGYQ